MATSCWRRFPRKAIPLAILVGILSVRATGLVSAVREARRDAHALATT